MVGVNAGHKPKVGVLYLVEEQPNPSSDFFVLPAVFADCSRIVRCSFAELPSPAELDGATVIFVRYVPSAWMKLIQSVRSRLRALIFFMDDDVLDLGASAGTPLRYRFKLMRLAGWRAGWLKRMGAELWVSTPYLLHKYSALNPKLVLPSPITNPFEVCRVFYHGSASHLAEIRWLYPVMEEVLRRDERITFEIVGGQDVYRLYRGLPRVTVVHPMKWQAYQDFLSLGTRHIGLAPLLEMPFNQARSYTKFFDITRCGAVGVYSPKSECAEVVTHGEDGLVVALDQAAWVEAILGLAGDGLRRAAMSQNARSSMDGLAARARSAYAELLMPAE